LIKLFAVFVFLQLYVLGYDIQAGEIKNSAVTYANGVYSIIFEAIVSSSQPQVYRVVTDYDQLYRLNDIIISSDLLTEPDQKPVRRRIEMQVCILLYCRIIHVVEDIFQNDTDNLVSIMVPDESDFIFGKSHWQIKSLNDQATQIILNSRMQPDFWVPPMIGPWLIKKKLIRELSTMIKRLEFYSGNNADR
jgi:hypothetical protein